MMFRAALIFTPIVITCTGRACRMMAGKITIPHIEANGHSAY